jgi:TPP-dependent indolepyruvate ferredoxin oxidoreductase alpha subunit
MEIQEVVEFNGVKYKLMGTRKYYLSQSTKPKERKGAKGLHVAIWEFHNKQTVPKGYHVHHKDGNTFNNDISNLQCLSRAEHDKIPKKINLTKVCEHLANIRPLTKAWHSTEKGKEFHKRISKMAYKNRTRVPFICKECSKEHKTYYPKTAKFCSDLCRGRFNRRKSLQLNCK